MHCLFEHVLNVALPPPHLGGVMFSPVFVCLSVCMLAGLPKRYGCIFMKLEEYVQIMDQKTVCYILAVIHSIFLIFYRTLNCPVPQSIAAKSESKVWRNSYDAVRENFG